MTFYDRVCSLCRDRGISITALALALGFSKGTPSNWKRMAKPPRAETIKKVANYFGTSVEYFYDEEQTEPTLSHVAAEPQKEKPTVKDDELSDKRKALIDVAVNATGDTLDLLLRVAQSISGGNQTGG